MATPKLPYYEKDAFRWRDHIHLTMQEIESIMRMSPYQGAYDRLQPLVWQLASISNDIEKTLQERKKK